MRLSTIWSIHNMTVAERLRRTREWGAMEFAAKLPKRVRYWTTMQEIAKATRNSENDVMTTPLDVVLKKLDAPKGMW